MNGSFQTPMDDSLINSIVYADNNLFKSSGINNKASKNNPRISTKPVKIGDLEVKVLNQFISKNDVRAVNSSKFLNLNYVNYSFAHIKIKFKTIILL